MNPGKQVKKKQTKNQKQNIQTQGRKTTL